MIIRSDGVNVANQDKIPAIIIFDFLMELEGNCVSDCRQDTSLLEPSTRCENIGEALVGALRLCRGTEMRFLCTQNITSVVQGLSPERLVFCGVI